MTSPARPRRRTVVGLGGLIVVIVALYVTVVALYASGSEVLSSGEENVPDGAVSLVLSPEKMDAATNRLTLSLLPGQTGVNDYTDGIVVEKPFSVLVSAIAGSRAVHYEADTLVAPTELSFVMDGAVEQWPFDRYSVRSFLVPVVDDAQGESVPLPSTVHLSGRGISGWDIAMTERDGPDGFVTVEFTASRSGATVAFGIVLLTLMVIIPTLVLVVAIAVLRGRRKVEVTALGWMGAMLFATIPLRNFLPGSPPIGSWIDYLIVLWVLAALVAGLVVFVIAWWRRGPA
ncbi:DUF4436 family protein [Microbacterium testaceum]|uniref:DUF4436 family protein n=1 Tax=Microbacterium testaceum TaxID=2033 RepID=UPI0007348507|nr:DUF4436 family protein [Microbacterium testaceum]